jgi:hypothetical protein
VNRPLPRGDRGHRSGDPGGQSRRSRSLPRTFRLVGRVAAVASKQRNSPRCATVGPRALGSRVGQPVLGSAPEVERPARACRAGQEGGAFDATC